MTALDWWQIILCHYLTGQPITLPFYAIPGVLR